MTLKVNLKILRPLMLRFTIILSILARFSLTTSFIIWLIKKKPMARLTLLYASITSKTNVLNRRLNTISFSSRMGKTRKTIGSRWWIKWLT